MMGEGAHIIFIGDIDHTRRCLGRTRETECQQKKAPSWLTSALLAWRRGPGKGVGAARCLPATAVPATLNSDATPTHHPSSLIPKQPRPGAGAEAGRRRLVRRRRAGKSKVTPQPSPTQFRVPGSGGALCGVPRRPRPAVCERRIASSRALGRPPSSRPPPPARPRPPRRARQPRARASLGSARAGAAARAAPAAGLPGNTNQTPAFRKGPRAAPAAEDPGCGRSAGGVVLPRRWPAACALPLPGAAASAASRRAGSLPGPRPRQAPRTAAAKPGYF